MRSFLFFSLLFFLQLFSRLFHPFSTLFSAQIRLSNRVPLQFFFFFFLAPEKTKKKGFYITLSRYYFASATRHFICTYIQIYLQLATPTRFLRVASSPRLRLSSNLVFLRFTIYVYVDRIDSMQFGPRVNLLLHSVYIYINKRKNIKKKHERNVCCKNNKNNIFASYGIVFLFSQGHIFSKRVGTSTRYEYLLVLFNENGIGYFAIWPS